MTAHLVTTATALHFIYDDYHTIIEGDSVLKHDFKALKACLEKGTNAAHIAKACDKIIGHLLSELQECSDDVQRINDESPVSIDEAESCDHHYSKLKIALEAFRNTHIKQAA